ncbi:hypothetical protein K474DRAFT_1671290 [Panus rudis PR-1116 ss-1]|nr:hypothetical protein K474DRAFT_1671290 [Panus rudis PR-1116 ss-1]
MENPAAEGPDNEGTEERQDRRERCVDNEEPSGQRQHLRGGSSAILSLVKGRLKAVEDVVDRQQEEEEEVVFGLAALKLQGVSARDRARRDSTASWTKPHFPLKITNASVRLKAMLKVSCITVGRLRGMGVSNLYEHVPKSRLVVASDVT